MSKILKILAAIIVFVSLIFVYLNNKVTYSVIIPVYNAEKYLVRCLDSILTQKGDFEVIAVDDGSTDKSLEILKEYQKKYPNLVVISQKNQGVAGARNTGLMHAKMKYITFVDNDDWLEPDTFRTITPIIKKEKSDIVLANYFDVYDREWVRNIRGEEDAKLAPEIRKIPSREFDKLSLLSPFYADEAISDLYYIGFVHGMFYKKSFIDKYQITFPSILGEDVLFNYKSFAHNPLISISTRPIYAYFNRVDAQSKSKKIIEEIPHSIEYTRQLDEYKNAKHRTQMFINDMWLFLYVVALNNLSRNNVPLDNWFAIVKETLKEFEQKYNSVELKSCRNYTRLKDIIEPNRSLLFSRY